MLYFTADDLAFTEKEAAEIYAAQLDDSTVIAITRHEANAAMKDMEDDGWPCLTDYDTADSDDE